MSSNLPAPTTSLEALAQAHEGEALALLVETMRDTEAKRDIRVKAAEAVLDRARGKPRQPTTPQRDPNARKAKAVSMSVETLMKIVQKASNAVQHKDAIAKQAQVLEGEFVPVVRKRPINEYAQVQALVPGTSDDVEDLLK